MDDLLCSSHGGIYKGPPDPDMDPLPRMVYDIAQWTTGIKDSFPEKSWSWLKEQTEHPEEVASYVRSIAFELENPSLSHFAQQKDTPLGDIL